MIKSGELRVHRFGRAVRIAMSEVIAVESRHRAR